MSSDDRSSPLGDLAYTDYEDLVANLRRDLQLDLSTDALSKSLTNDQLAPQEYAIVQNANDSIAQAGYTLASWTALESTQYFKATAAGLTVVESGLILVNAAIRSPGTVGAIYAAITINGPSFAGDYYSGVGAPNSVGPGVPVVAMILANAGDVLSLNVWQNSGANMTLLHSYLQAFYLCPKS